MRKHEKPLNRYIIRAVQFLLFLAIVHPSEASSLVNLSKDKMIYSKKNSIKVYVDKSEKGITYEGVRYKKFQPYSSLPQQMNPAHRYWAKYEFNCKESGDYYFYFGKGEYITAYVLKGGKIIKKELGDFTPRSEADVKTRPRSALIPFKKGESAKVYVRFRNETQSPIGISLKIDNAASFQKKYMFERLGIQALFHGAIWMMILYNIFLWFVVGDRSYLLYALYLFILSLTFFLHDKIHYIVLTDMAEYPKVMYFVEIAAAQLSIIMYFLFMQKMVDTKKLVPLLHKISTWWIILKALALPFLIWYNTYRMPDDTILNVLLGIDLVLLLLTCFLLLFKRDKVALYFALGSIVLAFCGLASILHWEGIWEWKGLEQMVQIGIISQIIIFSMGLGFKTRRNASLVFELQKQNEDLVSQLKGKVNEQEKTLRLFMRYVPEPVVAKALNKNADETIFDGELRYVTALFCDVRGFTSISEELKPRQVVAFLNDFYSVMTVVIKKYGGSVNQFIGDEIFAVFGAPLSTSNNEQRAVLAALEMVEKIQYLNDKYQPEFRRPIHIGIGMNAGEVVAGNLGSEEKIGYSIIGDPVNTAKRIEGLTKGIPNSIVISEAIYKKIAPIVEVIEMDEVSLKGKKNNLKTYRVLRKR